MTASVPFVLFVSLALVQLLTQQGTVAFDARVRPETVYVGQQVTYEATTLVDDAARARLRENPVYTPGEVRGATVYDFPFDLASVRDSVVGGTRYRVFTYRRALFPLTPGSYEVPGATLRYTAYAEADYGRPRQVLLTVAPARFLAVPLPRAGQPVGFNGVVGVFRDSLWTDGSPLRVGDPFTVTVRVAGVGNLDLLPRPDLSIAWATVTPAVERVAWDSAGTVVRGATEFDWVVTPRISGELVIPEVTYPYFDPSTARYDAAQTAPMRVVVAAAGAAAPVAVPRDTIGETPFPVLIALARRHALAVAIAATAVVLLAAVAIVVGRRSGDED